MMTEAIADATKTLSTIGKKQIGIPILPVFGNINGVQLNILDLFLRKKKVKIPIIATHQS